MDTTNAFVTPQAPPITAQEYNAPVPIQSQLVFSPHPEQEPIAVNKESVPVFIESSHPEPELSPEVSQAGVTVVAEQPEIKPEDRLVGIEPAKEAVPVQIEPTGLVTLPMTAQKAEELLKTDHNPADARVWAANMVLYELHRKHLQEELKKKGEQYI